MGTGGNLPPFILLVAVCSRKLAVPKPRHVIGELIGQSKCMRKIKNGKETKVWPQAQERQAQAQVVQVQRNPCSQGSPQCNYAKKIYRAIQET